MPAYQESSERRLDPDGGGGESGCRRGAALAGEADDGDGRLGRCHRRVSRRRGGRGDGDGVLALLPLPLRVRRLGVGRGPEPRCLRGARDRRVARAGRGGAGGRGGLRRVPGGLTEAPALGGGRRRLVLLPPLVFTGGLVLLAEEAAEPPRRLAHGRTWQLGTEGRE